MNKGADRAKEEAIQPSSGTNIDAHVVRPVFAGAGGPLPGEAGTTGPAK